MKRKTTLILFRTFLFLFLIILTGWVNAQSVEIKGTVTASDDNSAIAGANVFIKGTTTGTITDSDGNFSIMANEGDIIVISFVGYLPQEITAGSSSTNLNITLEPDLVRMDEVVVVGYGTQKKSDLTGAVTTVSGEELNRKPVATFEQSLQGLAPGVVVISNSGNPGAGASVQIRGVGSISNSNPLYVIDGVPSDGMGAINPSDIESISILKDAAAASIFGSRGANGVIIITTKKGSKGFQINFDAQGGVQREWKRLDLLNAQQYADYIKEVNYNAGGNIPPAADNPALLANNTDWQDEMFRTAPIQRYNLGVSGGNERITYNLTGGYFNQQGIMLSSGFERFNVRANSQLNWKRFNLGENITLSTSTRNNEKNNVGGRSQIERMLTQTPLVAVHDTSQLGGYGGPFPDHQQDAVNPVGVANLYDDKTKTDAMLGNVYGQVEILKGLKYRLSFGFDLYDRTRDIYEPAYQMGSYQQVGVPNSSLATYTNRRTILENLLTYNKVFNKIHNLELTAGYIREKGTYTVQTDLTSFYENDSTVITDNIPDDYVSGLISYIGRINYSFNDRYLFQANVRYDGSSKFGPEVDRYALFPSFSAGWVVSKENFLSGSNFISFLKLRGSWGQLGNQRINDYVYQLSTNREQSYVFGDVEVPGTGILGFNNAAVKWETKTSTNFGLDLGLIKNKINFTGEYYVEQSDDMLIEITMPESNGNSNFPYRNAGSVRNRGFEFSLNYRNYDRLFRYSVTGNLTTINNEVLDLNPSFEGSEFDKPLIGGDSELGFSTQTAVGHSIGEFYGFVTDGLYTNESQIDPTFAPAAQVGDIRYKDLNSDGLLTDADKTYLGSPIPKITYGFNISAEYKSFDLGFTLQGISGNKIYRETKLWTEGMYSNFNASTDVLNRFRASDLTITTTDVNGNPVTVNYPANTNTNMPRAVRGDPNNNALRFSDRFVEDGSYLRLKDLTIGYVLPSNLSEKIKSNRIRIYFTGLNLLTFTQYSGYDPEIGVTNLQDEENRNNVTPENLSRGIDNGYYPQARSFMGGIQIIF